MKILVALPSYKGFVAVDHAKSVQDLFLTQTKGVEWVRCASVGCPVLPRVRNAQVAMGLAQGCDAVLFIDDDIGFDAADVVRMINHGVGLVGAIPQKRNHRWNDPPRLAVSANGLRLDKATGLGIPTEPRLPMALTLIAAQVFRDIREAGLAAPFVYPNAGRDAQEHLAMYFGYELNPCPEWSAEYDLAQELGIENPMSEDGEDHYFCRRAALVGWDSVIDTEVELRHWEGQVCHDYSIKKMLAEGSAHLQEQPANLEDAA